MELNFEQLYELYPDLKGKLDNKLSNDILNGTDPQQKVPEELIEKAMDNLKRQRKGAQVFCVGCGAINKTLYKYGKVYLCKECKKKVEAREKT